MPELLAPAGDVVCLHAAVRAGADAVYLGADQFNARRGAGNFTLDQLGPACDYAHLRGVSVYLTVNTVILPSELFGALELVRQAWRAGVDAFIVQDIGLASRIRDTLPDAHLHVSTQMNTHNEAGLHAAAQLGASRVTLARELSLPEVSNMAEVAHGLGMQIEVFAHGALCICYSGQCFASSMVGGRSANRGMCAQACRLPYELHSASVRKPLDAPGPHLLSPKDLCTIDLLEHMLDAGVDSLKIEGRMKSPEYVHAVVSTYRAVLDRIEAPDGAMPAVTPEERQQLDEAFSRGFTQGYLVGQTGGEMMSYARPNNRGALVGRVARVGDGNVDVACEVSLARGDVLEFWTGSGHFTHEVGSFENVGKGVSRLPDVKRKVGKGDRVFRVRSAQAAFQDEAELPRVGVHGRVELHLGKPARMAVEAGGKPGRLPATAAEAEGPVVEAARTKAITAEEVREHIDRTGTTPFSFEALNVDVDEGAGMGFGSLHALRSQALDALRSRMLQPWAQRTLPKLQKEERTGKATAPFRRGRIDVCVIASNPACARAARKAGADAVYVPALNYKRGQAQVAGQLSSTVEQAGYPNHVVVALPVANHDPVPGTREEAFCFDPWAYVRAGKPVLAESLGDAKRALEAGALVEVGPHVPVTNPASARLLDSWGVSRIWLSPELTLGQIQAIAEEVPASFGVTIMGNQELMVTEHCLLQSQGPCNRECMRCPRRSTPHFLRDRKGYEMPVATDCCGRSHLYNAVSLDVAHAVPDIVAAGVSALMVDATLMTVEQTRAATQRAVRARDLAQSGKGAVSRAEGTTTGHLFRAIS